MTSSDPLTFKLDLVRQMAEQIRERVRRTIESATLQRSLDSRVVVNEDGTVGAEIFVPQYWAVYYHDGRGPVRPTSGKFIVYFQDIEDDPRVSGGRSYPVRAAQIRRLRLDPKEFRRLVEEGRLIVRSSVGPAQPHPFFEKLAGRVVKMVESTVNREFSRHAKAALADVLRLRGTIRLRLF